MKKSILTLLTLALLQGITTAQRTKPDKIKYGKISPEDLTMTQYAPDTAAAAVVLAGIGKVELETEEEIKGRVLGQGGRSQTKQIYVTYKYRFTNWQRVKLLKKSAFDRYGKKISSTIRPK